MKYSQAGDCLCYGLGKEFELKNENVDFCHLKAFIVYFYLLGIVSRRRAVQLKRAIYSAVRDSKRDSEKIIKMLVSELSLEFEFVDYESMFEVLNSIEIPSFVFDEVDYWFKVMPEIAFYKPYMYYIACEDETQYYLRRKDVFAHNNQRDLFPSFFFDYESNTSTEDLSNLYDQILGFDSKRGVLYLSPTYTDVFFTEYVIDRDAEIIHYGKFLGLINKCSVVECADNVSIVDCDNNKRKIIDKKPIEEYSVIGNRIYVEPNHSPGAIVPYYVDEDGKKIEISHKEKSEYIFRKLNSDNSLKEVDSRINSFLSEINFQNQKFTLKLLIDYFSYFDGDDQFIKNELFVIKYFRRYLADTTDFTDYLYMLWNVSSRLDYRFSSRIVSKSLENLLLICERSGELKLFFHDVQKMEEILLSHVYWTDRKIAVAENRSYCFIGGFKFDCDEGFIADRVKVSDGTLVGTTITLDINYRDGRVTYDISNGLYVIKYNRMLELSEFEVVCMEFNLPKEKCRLTVDDRETLI